MASSKKVSVDAQALNNAENTWVSFVKFTKVSTIFVIATLVIMAATLISWS
jgi:hypothetical protein